MPIPSYVSYKEICPPAYSWCIAFPEGLKVEWGKAAEGSFPNRDLLQVLSLYLRHETKLGTRHRVDLGWERQGRSRQERSEDAPLQQGNRLLRG